MDIEQLKLTLETAQKITDGAKDFGVWWLALHYGEKILRLMQWQVAHMMKGEGK